MVERTLAIIKPDAVRKQVIGDIIQRYEQAGLRPIAMKMVRLSKREAEGFYAVHRERPFFESLTSYMASGPVVVLVLEGEHAITRYRDLMGATDPAKAAPGTIRAIHGASIEANAVHGSDSPETAAFEISYFFPGIELSAC
ncbi:MAG: nucleoside-diphosphate kinase [Nitrospirae bacterium]|nr:MAG: nucleoside-diphosphate kinase [Nitrospirota bacterium]